MSSPIKSPQYKKAKGDEEMEQPETPPGAKRNVIDDSVMRAWAQTMQSNSLLGIDAKLNPIKEDVANVELDIAKSGSKAQQATDEAKQVGADLQKLRSEVEKRLDSIEQVMKPDQVAGSSTVVVGGLGQDAEEASKWVFDRLRALQ